MSPLTSGLPGSMNVYRDALLLVPQWHCISSFVFYTNDTYSWNDIAPNFERSLEYDLNKRFTKHVIHVSVNLYMCQAIWSDLKIFEMGIQNPSTTSSKSKEMQYIL